MTTSEPVADTNLRRSASEDGGWRLFRLEYAGVPEEERAASERLEARHWFTLAVIAPASCTEPPEIERPRSPR